MKLLRLKGHVRLKCIFLAAKYLDMFYFLNDLLRFAIHIITFPYRPNHRKYVMETKVKRKDSSNGHILNTP